MGCENVIHFEEYRPLKFEITLEASLPREDGNISLLGYLCGAVRSQS